MKKTVSDADTMFHEEETYNEDNAEARELSDLGDE